MNRKLSFRILLPNLIIVIGSLMLLFLAMLISVRVMMELETTKELLRARVMVDRWMRADTENNPGGQVNTILRLYKWVFTDVNVLELTGDMKYTDGAKEKPLPESELSKVTSGEKTYELKYQSGRYLTTALSYEAEGATKNLLLYISFKKTDNLIRQFALTMLLALAGAALVAALISIYASQRIADPLRKLSRWAHSAGVRRYGRFSQRSGTVEIDRLAESLNGMVQRIEEYDAAQKLFLQNASHELRTPLMSIQGYAEGIKHGVFSDTAGAADIIVEESLRLSALVDDLLYLSKLEMADDYYVFEPIKPDELLGQCVQKLEGAAIKEGKALALLPCTEPAAVNGDGGKLLRAVMNLAGNCLRYARTKVELALAVTGDTAIITVGDDGPGFDPGDIQHLFTRFYKGKQGKYGLGLSIAKAIVEKHGGTITAGNKPEGGALFTVTLPLLEKNIQEQIKH